MFKSNRTISCGGRLRAAAVGLLAGLAACTGSASGDTGRLTASWKGGDSGRLAAPANAAWCSVGGLLEIMAVAGDSGIAVLLYPTDGIRSGNFTVIDPLREPVHAGGAALAARWPSADQIIGFRGVSGKVALRVENGQLAGDLEGLLLRPGAEAESLHFTASFASIRADSGPTACPPDSGGRRRSNDSTLPAPGRDSVRH